MARSESGWHPGLAFLAGALAGGAGAVLVHALRERRDGFDPDLIRASRDDPDLAPTVVLPGILGSELIDRGGSKLWLNVGNVLGHHALGLPMRLPIATLRDDLRPGGLLGVDTVLPRLFGFTEYADLLDLLEEGGFVRDDRPFGAVYHVFTYDWRLDLVATARALDDYLDGLAEARGDRDARFNLVAHSMGGLVARYYLRHGAAAPGGPVTWAGARRINQLVQVTTPNGGSIGALDAILNGNRVGFSTTTMAASVISAMPAIYQLLPPREFPALLDHRSRPIEADLHSLESWERFGWGPFSPEAKGDLEEQREFLGATLQRARSFHESLLEPPGSHCPVPMTFLGGDTLPTLARVIVPEERGATPRLEADDDHEAQSMFEAGDGRVTRASALASIHPDARHPHGPSGIPELSHAFMGGADHHGIYQEPTFQSILLRLLLRSSPRGVD